MIYTIKQVKQRITKLKERGHWNCKDCGKNTFQSNIDYYIVTDKLWLNFGISKGMLCFSCFEKRLGKSLTKEDFIDCGVNEQNILVKKLQNGNKTY